jgi:threonine/homoserine/homoserine lactone efflux protein
MIPLAALVAFAAALAVVTASPGPSIAALVARVFATGLKSVAPFLAAMWIGELVWLSAAVLGLSFLAQQFQLAFTLLKYCGSAYLLYLAWKAWTAPTEVSGGTLPDAGSPMRMFLAGLAITLGNPKIMVFYMALLPSLVDLARVSVTGWLELSVVAVLVCIACDLTWAVMASKARTLLKSRRAVQAANRTSAVVMGGAALAIAVK